MSDDNRSGAPRCYMPDARAWLHARHVPNVLDLTDRQVVNRINRLYVGGWLQFIRDRGFDS